MKTKLRQFYQEKIKPSIEALKTRADQFKQWAGAWLARSRRRLWLVAMMVISLAVVATLAYLWHRSPDVRAGARSVVAAVTGGLVSLWALFRGHRPTEIPVPVAVTEPPYPRKAEAVFPVEDRAEDDQ